MGGVSTGVEARQPEMKPGDVFGHFLAINPFDRRKKVGDSPTKPKSAGMLATAGGLIFTGESTGEFLALDEETGKTLWQFKTGSSVNSTAITYTHNGRQYVSIASCRGALATRYAAAKVPAGPSGPSRWCRRNSSTKARTATERACSPDQPLFGEAAESALLRRSSSDRNISSDR